MDNNKLEKIEKQLELLMLKVDIIYNKIIQNENTLTQDTELMADDELYDEAKNTVVMAGVASASLLQRRLRIGYARAARLLDILEQEGVIGPPDGAKPRDVLVSENFVAKHLFSLDLLKEITNKSNPGNVEKYLDIIKKTFRGFNIKVSMGDVNIGPSVALYTVEPSDGVSFDSIKALKDDLSLALAVHPIRIEAPIPGKNIAGIEIPNKIAATVGLREILESDEFKESKSNLTLALGRDVAGIPVVADLKQTPHILMSGATGSGKSVCIGEMILSLLYQNSPRDLRLILDDAKRVEFSHYKNIPHLLCPIINDADKTVSALKWLVAETDRRFYKLQETSQRNIEDYNRNNPNNKLPHIVMFIDEFADCMAAYGEEVEASVVRLGQMSRAVGIHLVIATSRPSHDVLTGIIKINIPNRIGLVQASKENSQTIIDTSGAENLLGYGDMLFGSKEDGYKRVQGALVTDHEIDKVTDFLKTESVSPASDIFNNTGSKDELYSEAKAVAIKEGKASSAILQRHLKIGYARACRLLDSLEEDGIIGPPDGAKPRDILVDK